MMNLTATSMATASAAASAAPAAASAAASAPAAAATAAGSPAPRASTQGAVPGAPPFAQWMGLGLADTPPGAAADTAPDGTTTGKAGGSDSTAATQPDCTDDGSAATAQGPATAVPLLAAMAMPLMPVAAPQAAARGQAAAGGSTGLAPVARGARAAASTSAPAQLPASVPGASDDGAMALPSMTLQPAQAAAPEHGTSHAAAAPAPFALAADTPARQDATPDPAAASLTPALGVAAPAPQAQPAASVALAGPPATWRQALHEALGERIDLQMTKNSEQAVIRLDPPNLGRIEIAIRHAAGSLEVTLSATHGEVLRQLHAVSDGLRNDLAQRQFTEVAVSVAPAPRSQAGAPFAGHEGRGGRHGGQQQEQQQAPGHALRDGEARPASAFSLT